MKNILKCKSHRFFVLGGVDAPSKPMPSTANEAKPSFDGFSGGLDSFECKRSTIVAGSRKRERTSCKFFP